MKRFAFSFSHLKKIVLASVLYLPFTVSSQVLLSQDFNSSNGVDEYVGKGKNQFDYIGVSAWSNSNTVYGFKNKMALQRYGGTAALVKSTNLSTTSPTFLKISFKMSVPFNTISPQGTQAVFYVGSGLFAGAAATNELPNNGSRHSQIGVGFGSAKTFYFKNTATGQNSDSLTGESQINWYINKTGNPVTYTNPAGGTSTLANNVADLWAGDKLILAGIIAVTPTQTLDNFKFIFNGTGGGAIVLDDIIISTGDKATLNK